MRNLPTTEAKARITALLAKIKAAKGMPHAPRQAKTARALQPKD